MTAARRRDTPHETPQLTLLGLAAATASGIGVLGFVVFVGGVLLWTRFDQMGLPADHAVALVPRSELISTGASFLAPAVAATILQVVLLLLIKGGLPANRQTWDAKERLANVAATAGLLIASQIAIAIYSLVVAIPAWAFIVLLAAAAATTAVMLLAEDRVSVASFALISFASLGGFFVLAGYMRASDRPTVIPMAYVRQHPGEPASVEFGYFVAETSDRVYFASVPNPSLPDSTNATGPNELREFARSESTDLEVGDVTFWQDAPKLAARFALNLCRRLNSQAAVSSAGRSSVTMACSPLYLAQLAAKAG